MRRGDRLGRAGGASLGEIRRNDLKTSQTKPPIEVPDGELRLSEMTRVLARGTRRP
jgi:hypothetical protein